MQYQAKPIIVDAYPIRIIGERWANGNLQLFLEGAQGEVIVKEALPDMMTRYAPVVGDYWVISPDGYEYLNPKSVFESKYLPVEAAAPTPPARKTEEKPLSQVYDAQKPELGLRTISEIEQENLTAAMSDPGEIASTRETK